MPLPDALAALLRPELSEIHAYSLTVGLPEENDRLLSEIAACA
jgi:hypothetical protein